MTLPVAGQVGPAIIADGVTTQPFRQGRSGEIIAQEMHGRFFEQAFRGNLFSGGMSALTSINAATFTTATLGATATPIAGVWNPGSSLVNLVILQAILGITITAATATGCGPFEWAVSTGNNAISTGVAAWNRKTLTKTNATGQNVSTAALTGLTNNLVVMHASALTGGQATSVTLVEGTVAAPPSIAGGMTVENLDGSIIVPPGGVLALLATTTPVAHSAVSALIWEETPL